MRISDWSSDVCSSDLFVPGDSERKFAKARDIGADVLILDLEDAVAPSMKDIARARVAALLDDRSPRDWAFFVRVNPFDTGMTFNDLAAVVKPGLDGRSEEHPAELPSLMHTSYAVLGLEQK